jgi:hypothetical protein
MTTMGVGLFYSTKQIAKQVGISGSRTEALYSSESCITRAAHWIEEQSANGPPCQSQGAGKFCKRVSESMKQYRLGGETASQINRMNTHGYTCDISLLGTVAASGGSGTGSNIGQNNSYGGSATSTKYLYKIKVKANASNKVVSEVEAVVSTIF